MRRILLAILCTVMLTVPAQAQEAPPEVDVICTTHADYWQGTFEETQSINTNPVPERFSSQFNVDGQGCFNLVVTSILTWHRDFGDEASMRAAIEFLSAKALKRLERSFSEDSIEDIEYQSKAYATIANYYAFGAQAFESRPLIEEAISYYEKANALAVKIPPNDAAKIRLKSDLGHEYFYFIDRNPSEDLHRALEQLSQDIYVLRAYISGDEADVVFAAKLVEAHAPQFVKETVRAAEVSVEPICETEDEALQEKMEKACVSVSGDYEDFVREHLMRKALLATVMDGLSDAKYPKESDEALYGVRILLLNAERQGVYSPLEQNYPYNDMWLRALIAGSDSYVRFGKKNSDSGFVIQGLNFLVHTERYAARHARPSQWKRLAERYVVASAILDEIYGETAGESFEQEWYRLRQQNQLRYFQEGLAALERSP